MNAQHKYNVALDRQALQLGRTIIEDFVNKRQFMFGKIIPPGTHEFLTLLINRSSALKFAARNQIQRFSELLYAITLLTVAAELIDARKEDAFEQPFDGKGLSPDQQQFFTDSNAVIGHINHLIETLECGPTLIAEETPKADGVCTWKITYLTYAKHLAEVAVGIFLNIPLAEYTYWSNRSYGSKPNTIPTDWQKRLAKLDRKIASAFVDSAKGRETALNREAKLYERLDVVLRQLRNNCQEENCPRTVYYLPSVGTLGTEHFRQRTVLRVDGMTPGILPDKPNSQLTESISTIAKAINPSRRASIRLIGRHETIPGTKTSDFIITGLEISEGFSTQVAQIQAGWVAQNPNVKCEYIIDQVVSMECTRLPETSHNILCLNETNVALIPNEDGSDSHDGLVTKIKDIASKLDASETIRSIRLRGSHKGSDTLRFHVSEIELL